MSVEPAAGQPVITAGGSRWRALVIALVAVLAVGIGAVSGAFLLNAPSAGLGSAAGYVPADAVMYFEARLDLPGSQRESLRAILDRFPGVDVDDYLGEALADTLDTALADGNAPFDYSNDIAPWFTGQVAVALLEFPAATDPMQLEVPPVLGLVGVSDAAAATAFADGLRSDMEAGGASFTSSEHGSTTVWTLDLGEPQVQVMGNTAFAYAVTDDQILMASDAAHVTSALDVHGGSGQSLSDRPEVVQLGGSLPAERVGVMTLDTAVMLEQMRAELEATQPEIADALSGYLDGIPDFNIMSLSFESDAVRVDSATGVPDGVANSERSFAEQAPADAIFLADADGLGAGLEQFVTTIKATLAVAPGAEAQLAQLEQVEDALGATLEEFVAWIGGGAIVAGWDGEEPYVGLILEAADADAARQRMNQLRALAELGALDPTSNLTVTSDTVGEVEITTISGDLSAAGVAGAPAGVVEWAIDGDRVLIGIGDRFVRGALALDPADSLAQTDRFRAAVDRFGGSPNGGVLFLDLAGLREAVASVLPPEVAPGYESVAPNLEPLDYLVSVTRVEGEAWVGRMALVLR